MTELKYKLENDDFIAFNLHFAKSSSTHRDAVRKACLITSAVTAVALFWIFYWWLENWIAACVAAVIGAVLVWLMLPREYWKQVKKTISKMVDHEGIGEPGCYRLRMEESGLREEVDGNVTITRYSSISRIEETDEHIFIYLSRIRAYIIPKREVGSRFTDFLQELRRRCEPDTSRMT